MAEEIDNLNDIREKADEIHKQIQAMIKTIEDHLNIIHDELEREDDLK